MVETVLVSNAVGRVRRQSLNGRDYLVAPMTLMVSGVLDGSKGPLYYPPDEIKMSAPQWNGVPIVVYHPTVNGEHVSASLPGVLQQSGIGFLAEAVYNGKLGAEGWFDVERTTQVDKRVYDALTQNTPLELSTGLFTINEDALPNSSNMGRPYTHVARAYRPDHLAVLPDQTGACSIKDGCGVLVNEKKDQQGSLLQDIKDAIRGNKDVSQPATNAMSTDGPPAPASVMKPGANPADSPGKCPRCGAPLSANGACKICGYAPAPVAPKPPVTNEATEQAAGFFAHVWRYLSGSNPNSITSNTGNHMDRQATIGWLVTNCKCWEGDGQTLNNFSDERLTNLKDMAEKAIQVNQQTTPSPSSQIQQAVAGIVGQPILPSGTVDRIKPTANPNRLTADEQATLNWAQQEMTRQKHELVGKLISNVADASKQSIAAVYNRMTLDELRALASVVPTTPPVQPHYMPYQPTPNPLPIYAGAAGLAPSAVANPTGNVGNQGNQNEEDILIPLTLNYSKSD